MSVSISTAAALSKYLGLEAGTYSAPAIRTCNKEEAFFLCLEHFYRLGMKRTNFRVRVVLSSPFSVFYLPFQHLSLAPTVRTDSSEDLLSDALITLDAFGINRSASQLSEASCLRPHVSLFEGAMDGSSDLELDTEDDRHVMPFSPYRNQNNNALHRSLDQSSHLAPFNAKWTEISEQELCDDYDLSEDEVGPRGSLEQPPLNKNDHLNDYFSDLAAHSDIACVLEEPDGDWPISTRSDWSPDSLSSQEYERGHLGKVSSPWVDSTVPPLKMPTSLYLPASFEDILDPLHLGYGEYDLPNLDHLKHNPNALENRCIVPCEVPVLRSSTQTEDIIQACLVSQESSSGDHYFELESDMETNLVPDLVSKPRIADGDHGIMAFDFALNPSQTFISRNGALHSGLSMCGCREGPAGVITDEDFHFYAIEYDSDV